MDGQDFLTEYRNISNKLKKRFLRRPNVAEASDHFRQLAKRLDDHEEPEYAGVCYLATARCEQTIGNSYGEIESTIQAARSFLKAELLVQKLQNPSYEEHLASAVAAFQQAAKLQEEAGRPALAAGLHSELGEALENLGRPAEAMFFYEKALLLDASTGSILDTVLSRMRIADCYIALGDYHNALKLLTQVASFAAENDPCGLYSDRLANVEILRVILLLIIEPVPQNTPPHLLQVIDKYKWEGEHEPCPFLDPDISTLLQSIVMAIQVEDKEALLYLEDEVASLLTSQQRGLLRVLVAKELRKS